MSISRVGAYPMLRYLGTVIILAAIVIGIFLITSGHFDGSRFRKLELKSAVRSLNERIDRQGTVAAWEYLQKVYMSDGIIIPGNSDTHSLAHAIGVALYKERGLAGLSICNDAFTDGCYHGVIQAMTAEQGMSSMAHIGTICLSQEYPRACAHGAGHGVSEAANFDLAKAIAFCDEFPESLSADCAEGAIMANSWTWRYEGDLVEKEPWEICKGIAKTYQVACASAVGSYFANEAGKVYTSAYMAHVCSDAPTEEMSSMCLSRVSQRIVKNAEGKVEAIKKECRTMPVSQYQPCLIEAARFERSLGYVRRDTSTAAVLCTMFFAELPNACPLKDEVPTDGVTAVR